MTGRSPAVRPIPWQPENHRPQTALQWSSRLQVSPGGHYAGWPRTALWPKTAVLRHPNYVEAAVQPDHRSGLGRKDSSTPSNSQQRRGSSATPQGSPVRVVMLGIGATACAPGRTRAAMPVSPKLAGSSRRAAHTGTAAGIKSGTRDSEGPPGRNYIEAAASAG
ncbi:hypothetical protein NDU88_008260 [Pleurodeles waltl]|uniref:Uncharacterized protein n=1 Tax=Pleurodeles waltl TaxID=8319 RepID=A0AAV7VS12_PLEWA|nr:hypothetical protein NDU88_008260 [Pleurodeles waltl]